MILKCYLYLLGCLEIFSVNLFVQCTGAINKNKKSTYDFKKFEEDLEDIDDCAPLNDSDFSDSPHLVSDDGSTESEGGFSKERQYFSFYERVDRKRFTTSGKDWTKNFSLNSVSHAFELCKFLLDFNFIKENQKIVTKEIFSLLKRWYCEGERGDCEDFIKKSNGIIERRFGYVKTIEYFCNSLMNEDPWLKRVFCKNYLNSKKFAANNCRSVADFLKDTDFYKVEKDGVNYFKLALILYCDLYKEYVNKIIAVKQTWLRLIFLNRFCRFKKVGMFDDKFEDVNECTIKSLCSNFHIYFNFSKQFFEHVSERYERLVNIHEKVPLEYKRNMGSYIREVYNDVVLFLSNEESGIKEWCENVLARSELTNLFINLFVKEYKDAPKLKIIKEVFSYKCTRHNTDIKTFLDKVQEFCIKTFLDKFREFCVKTENSLERFKSLFRIITYEINLFKILKVREDFSIDYESWYKIKDFEIKLHKAYANLIYMYRCSHLYSSVAISCEILRFLS